jgi:LysR family glycine cleavage system transcriptional activator
MNSMTAHEMVIPNLGLFERRLAGGNIQVVMRNSMKTFQSHEADAGVRIGHGEWPGVELRRIGPLSTQLLCAPSLSGRVRDWDDFFEQTLFCARSRRTETVELLCHPASGRHHAKVVEFQTLAEATRAAEAGLGVVAGFFPLMGNLVRQNRLVMPFFNDRPSDESVYFIYRPDHPRRRDLDRVFDCLHECYRSLPSPGHESVRT